MGSIDWGYPNPDAIAAMIAYGVPEDAINAAVPSGPMTELVLLEDWKTLVEEYKTRITDPSHVTPLAFTERSDWLAPEKSGFRAPEIESFKGEAASASGVAVNTAALEWFANVVLGSVVGPKGILIEMAQDVAAVDPRPGAFARAEALRLAIVGATAQDGGVKGDIKQMLVNMNTALLAVQDALLKMAAQYNDLEELNSLTTEELNAIMGDSLNGLDSLKSYGQKTISTDGN